MFQFRLRIWALIKENNYERTYELFQIQVGFTYSTQNVCTWNVKHRDDESCFMEHWWKRCNKLSDSKLL